jgi:N,N'-diacetyllegionaminate synthase
MVASFRLADHEVGTDHPCFIIAEAGVNHNGSIDQALRLIDAAVNAGADAVKFQTFSAEKLISPDAPKAKYQQETTGELGSQLDLVKKFELTYDGFRTIFAYCKKRGILFLSTPFEEQSADFLEHLGVTAFKVPSGEITNIPFLNHLSKKGKPLIVSTGMSTLGEVENALLTIQTAGNPDVVLLHCVSNYPANPKDVNLRAMLTMKTAFDVPVGFSDHTLGIEVALAAVALGASIIEKHFTLDRNLPGPDHKASLEPYELKMLVKGIRVVELALGHGRKQPAASEANTAVAARKSLVIVVDVPTGKALTEDMIAIQRPGNGLPPSLLSFVVGRTAKVNIPAGTVISMEMLA